MQHDDLDRDKAICDAASAGPWSIGNIIAHPWTKVPIHVGGGANRGNCFAEVGLGGPGAIHGDVDSAKENAEFMVAARTAWPARIEECRRLREREAALLAEIERLKAAGEVLAETTRTNWAGEISRKEDEACRVFEERK